MPVAEGSVMVQSTSKAPMEGGETAHGDGTATIGGRHRTGLRRLIARMLPRRLVRDERGAAAVEFAIVAMPFFALIAAILETAFVFFAGQILDAAVTDAARLVRTGQAQQQGMDVNAFKTQICNRLYAFFTCASLSLDVRTSTSFTSVDLTAPTDSKGNFDPSKFGYNAGHGTDIVVIRAYYLYPLIFTGFGLNMADQPGNTRLLSGVAVFANEPFPW